MTKDINRADQQPTLRRRSRSSLPELAYETIIEAIIDRRFAPSARLSIDRLAEELEMSNTPVREALTRMATEKLVIQDNNRGYTVAPLLNNVEYDQLFDVRRLVETHALRISEFDSSAIEQLQEIASQMPLMASGPIYHDFRDFNLADSHFHRILVGMSGNRFLIEAWDNLHFHLHMGRLYAGTGIIDFRQGLEEHRAISEVIQTGDKDQLLRVIEDHIESAQKRLKVLIQTTPE